MKARKVKIKSGGGFYNDYPAYADLEGDERYRQITARMVLSHSTGFPNWRFLEPDGRLKILFSPGARHSYSGEGIALLQMVIEAITGQDLETLAQEKVFHPLGMTRTSYIWQAAYETNAASPHDEIGRPRGESIQRNQPDAAGSLTTTAGDYARFIVHGILNVEGRRKATRDEMLRPQISINDKTMSGPGAWQETNQYQDIHLAWGLGWGRFDTPHGRAFFHTGHSIGWQNYTVTYPDKGIGIVLLGNSDNFESVAQEIVAKAIGDVYTPFGWLGYLPFDPSRPKTSPPPDPVSIAVDPAVLATYAGIYDMQPTALFQIKFEDDQLWVRSMDGASWEPLSAETETRFFVEGEAAYRFEFIRDASGEVTGLRMEYLGIQFSVAPKRLPDSSAGGAVTAGQSKAERTARVENGLVLLDAKGQPQWGSTSTLADRMEYYRAPGVNIAVIDAYQLDWVKGFGVRIAGGDEPVTTQTLFHAGSVAKSISAAATLTLVEGGLLNLDEDVNNGLVSWRVPENEYTRVEKATLRRLLSHSAGIKDGLTDRGPDDPMPAYLTFGDEVSGVTLQQLLKGMPEDDIESTRVVNIPGTSYRYTNADYAILELLVEDRLGQPFEDFVQATVLDRLGMAWSSYHQPLPPDLRALFASEHTLDGKPVEGGRANFPFHAAGSLWTTPGDLAVFIIDLMKAYQGETGHLLSPQIAQQMLSPQIEIQNNPLSDAYGLGVELQSTSQGPKAWHTGGTWGSCSLIWFYPQTGKGVVVMINSASGSLLRFEILLSVASAYDWALD